MARNQTSNTLSIIVWVMGLLGCAGYLNPFGFFALIIPVLFWLFGNKFTKAHCREYFNVLLTGALIYLIGLIINKILEFFKVSTFDFMYLALIYFGIMSIIGLIQAVNNKRFRPVLSVNLFK